ncbi:hypothetical protein PCANC_02117 [Puccinia coronata f. sp. avenae]|uniref:Uncharacterized protein n=1 Tax=Puccinia coronata f. sp. avenae TaxID=200324 RepID=A0A2N5VZT1_9BASI|nr:hypothetical protein PCANC_02117 [Puccinia coronata f. sp. avenae]
MLITVAYYFGRGGRAKRLLKLDQFSESRVNHITAAPASSWPSKLAVQTQSHQNLT